MTSFHHSHRRTLVVGATSHVGRHVVAGLVARDVPVRTSSRRPRRGAHSDGVEHVVADLRDPLSLRAAFEGVDTAFLLAEEKGVEDVVEVARRADVRRVVLLSSGSVVHPSSAGNPITEAHRRVEEAWSASGLEVVPVRPLVLATNALGWASGIRSGRLALYRPEAETAPVHERDVASVAVAALAEGGKERVSDLLTGPRRLTQREQVQLLASASGRHVEVRELDRAEARDGLSGVLSQDETDGVLAFLDDAARGASPATDTVRVVTGREPADFTTWATEHAADLDPDQA